MTVWKYEPRPRRWWGTLRDIPLLLADRIGDDQESRWLKAAMSLVLLAFGLAMALWVVAWALR